MPLADEKTTSAPKAEKFDPTKVEGFSVMVDNTLVGTYETEEDAQAFIDGHLTPQKKTAKIVEGHSDNTEDEAA